MFTGLVEEIGKVKNIKNISGGKRIAVGADFVSDDVKVDDSISVNGVCLTAVSISNNIFEADAVGETLNKSTLNEIKVGSEVNLERALKLSDRLGGHFVQGHVNGIGSVNKITKLGDNYSLTIRVPEKLTKYIVDEGSITLDGISLTVARIKENYVEISIIPHTWNHTTLRNKQVGSKINVETDILGKYIEKLLNSGQEDEKFTEDWFRKLGY